MDIEEGRKWWSFQPVTVQPTPKVRAAAFAKQWAKDIRRSITDGEVTPPLAPATIAKKGHDTPLLESGTLRKAITGIAKLTPTRTE